MWVMFINYKSHSMTRFLNNLQNLLNILRIEKVVGFSLYFILYSWPELITDLQTILMNNIRAMLSFHLLLWKHTVRVILVYFWYTAPLYSMAFKPFYILRNIMTFLKFLCFYNLYKLIFCKFNYFSLTFLLSSLFDLFY